MSRLPTEELVGGPESQESTPVVPDLRPPAGRRVSRRSRIRNGLPAFWFVAPSLALVFTFFVTPFAFNTVFAFLNWTSYSDLVTWGGLANFQYIWDFGILGQAVKVTAIYALVVMVVQNAVSLSLAVLMTEPSRTNGVFRTVYFIPVLISPLAAGYIWSAMLRPRGPLNDLISAVVPGEFHYAWLGHSTSALIACAFVEAWKWSGLMTLVYIAGLNSIPRPLVEAAMVDGASRWRRFWQIKVPLLVPAFTFNIVTSFVGSLSAFDIVMSTTSGGPGNATSVLNVALYRQFSQGFYGNASALSLVVTILVLITAIPLVTWLRRREVAV